MVNLLFVSVKYINKYGEKFTEERLNHTADGKTISKKALPEAFHSDEYGILIVAEKYQTGFDEPLLHTMFVDKKAVRGQSGADAFTAEPHS